MQRVLKEIFSKVKKRRPTCKRLELATHGNLTFRAQEFTGNLKILRAQQGSQLSWTAQRFEILSLISADPNHVFQTAELKYCTIMTTVKILPLGAITAERIQILVFRQFYLPKLEVHIKLKLHYIIEIYQKLLQWSYNYLFDQLTYPKF